MTMKITSKIPIDEDDEDYDEDSESVKTMAESYRGPLRESHLIASSSRAASRRLSPA